MPELLSVHGRCPRCGQVLVIPAGQLQSVFRCARCQYRALGSALVDEARSSPPQGALPVLRPFEEDSDDQRTRVLLPGGNDDQSEIPVPAIPIGGSSSSAPAAPRALERFAASDDLEDQQTRLHVAGSFDAPVDRAPAAAAPHPPRMPSIPPPPGRALPAPQRAVSSGATRTAPAASFQRVTEDADDQATRLHLPDDLGPPPGARMRSAPAPNGAATLAGAAALSRITEEPDDQQHTRLQVPISYEEDPPAPELRPLVAPRPTQPPWVDPEEALTAAPTGSSSRATLALRRWIDEWVQERHAALLSTLALLCAVVAPLLDATLGNTRRGATVIAANLVLFFLWTLAFAWFGKMRNDAGVWDYRVGWTRFFTVARLALEDLGRFGSLPWPLKWRVVSEVSSALGLFGLGAASLLTLTQLVWGTPASDSALVIGRAASGMLVLLSVVASRQTQSVPLGFVAAPEVAAPAVAHFPAVVDLTVPLSLGPNHAATPVHQMLELLSQWPPREWPNKDSYRAALERHLMRHMGWARIEREHRLGTLRSEGVADFIVNDSLLIEVMRGFDAEEAERVSAKMRMLAKTWRGKPAMIVIFDASRAALIGSIAAAPLEVLHQSYPMLAVRMPSARLSVV
jgi:hypothetical protein